MRVTVHEVVGVCLSDDNHEEELEEAESPVKKKNMNFQYKVEKDRFITELMPVYS
jgi:hypothetical protein